MLILALRSERVVEESFGPYNLPPLAIEEEQMFYDSGFWLHDFEDVDDLNRVFRRLWGT